MKKLFILLSVGGILTLNACKKNHIENDKLQTLSGTATLEDETQYAEEGEPTVLGEQLPNFYTIANMKEAYQSLLDEPKNEGNRSLNPVRIRATHKYIKFKPTTEEQLDAVLKSDFVVYDHPLDRQELIVGKFYRDPNVPNDQPTYQYATVRNGTTLPEGIDYEVLTEMYIPEEDIELLGTGNANYKFVYTLVQRAENISGFKPWELAHNTPWANLGEPGEWYTNPNVDPPGGGGAPVYGTIRIFDTRLNALIPFEGAKVTARRGARTRQGFTNANGQYGLDGFPFTHGTKVDFKLHMDREHYAVKDNNGSRANIKRNNIQSNHWSHDITVGYENMQGHMFRAAFRYFYLNIDGLRRPRDYGSTSLIAKYDKDFAGHYNGFTDRIRVVRTDENDEVYDSDEYFGITIHELAHLSHKNVIIGGGLAFDALPDLIPESWAIAVQWHLTNIEYRGRGIVNYGAVNYFISGLRRPHVYAYQFWNVNIDPDYSSLFINLVDNFNEMGNNFPLRGVGVINDQVSGYSLPNIEAFMLHNVYGLGSLSTQLKAYRPQGVTEAQIDQLLSQY